MRILSVTLKNFKAHGDRHYAFESGTNVICGENGAGKTSILEAIAWTIFNYRGDYRKEDLIRNGAASAQATISFVSSHDNRTYDVQRCTSKGYALYDPQINQRLPYTRIEDEVTPWLRQHLGVAPGTDLARLFANTIGVPQGTFTADFLQTGEKRKQVFDAILKVEEFKQVYSGLNSLRKYSEGLVETLKREIGQYAESLTEQAPLQQVRDQLAHTIQQDEATLQQLEQTLASLETEKNRLTQQAERVQKLEAELRQSQMQQAAKQQEITSQQQALDQAQQAVQLCDANRQGHDTYLQVEVTLTMLEQHVKQRRVLIQQRQVQQQERSQLDVTLATLASKLEDITRTTTTIEQLTPLVQQQEQQEQRQQEIQQALQRVKQLQVELEGLERQVDDRRTEWRHLSQDIKRIQELEATVGEIPTLEQQRDRLQAQLSRVEAAKQFENELRQLVTSTGEKRDRHSLNVQAALAVLQQLQQTVPELAAEAIAQTLTHMETGVSLHSELLNALEMILADLGEQISASKLRRQLQRLRPHLDQAYRAQAEMTSLEVKRQRQQTLQAEAESIQQRIQVLTHELKDAPDLAQQQTEVAIALTQLDNPRGRLQLLNRELKQKAKLEADRDQKQEIQAKLLNAIAQLDQELAQYENLDEEIEGQRQQRQHYQVSYQAYLQHQAIAAQFSTLESRLHHLKSELAAIDQGLEILRKDWAEATQNYDPAAWKQVEAEYTQLRSQADQIRGSLPQQRQRLQEQDARLTALEAIAHKQRQAEATLKEKEKSKRFVNFSRRVYKDAAPRITERYVQTISKEADRLFRELLNRQNVALEWTRDYEIIIQEGAHRRRFINLSGGEQMCAALAVRLALLRVLADIDVAFFDEPTTNMDRPRRQRLAEAIANIRTFQQIFVISHDDTFEQFTEHLVYIERE